MKNRILLFVLSFLAFQGNAQCTWTGVDGNWSDASNWSCGHVPEQVDDVVINGGRVTIDVAEAGVKLANMTLSGGTLITNTNKNIDLTGTLTWNSAAVIGGGGTMTVAGAATISGYVSLGGSRTLKLNGGGTVTGVLNSSSSSNLIIPLSQTLICTPTQPWGGGPGLLTIEGTLIKRGTIALQFGGMNVINTGTITVEQGGIIMDWDGTHTGATININGTDSYFYPIGGTHTFTGCTFRGNGIFGIGNGGNGIGHISTFTGNTVYNTLGIQTEGTFTLGQSLEVAYWNQLGNGTIEGTSDIIVNGNLTINQAGSMICTINNTGNWTVKGNLNWSGGTIGGSGTMTVAGTTKVTNSFFPNVLSRTFINPSTGIIKGAGTLNMTGGGSLTNNGIIAPGLSPGTLYINPSVSSTVASIYEMEIMGNQADKLESSGNIALNGTLKLILNNPSLGSYTIFNSTGGSVSGYPSATLSILYSVNGGAFSATPPPNMTITQPNANTIVVNITPTACPTVSITNLNPSYCKNASAVTLTGSPSSGTFEIDGNGSAVTIFDPSVLSIGNHSVVYTYSDGNGCSNSASQTVTVNPMPIVSITNLNTNYCHGALGFTLTGSPSGGIFTVAGVETTHFDVPLLSVGNHSVVYTYADGNGCSNSASQTVTINALPNVSLPTCKTVYIGYTPAASDILTAITSSGALYYKWSNSSTTQSITVSPSVTTTYTVTATDVNGCMAVASTTVESFNVSCTFKLKGKNVIGVSMCQPAVGRTKAKDLCVDPTNVLSNLNQGNKLGNCGLVACEPYTSPSPNNAFLNGDRQGNSAIVEKKKEVLIYPNPAQDAFTIDFNLDQMTDVTMLLSDINGRTLWSKEVKNAHQGSETVDINDFPVGVYFVKFLALGEEAQIHRLVITK